MKPNIISEIEISYKPTITNYPTINSSKDAFHALKGFFSENTIALQEQFCVAFLNKANKIIGISVISIGGITGTVADPRIILAIALKSLATGIILCHNHPSGNLKPSEADIQLTKKINSACNFLDINLLDHIIISPNNDYYSFKDEYTL